MRISDWSSDVCSSDLAQAVAERLCHRQRADHRFLAPVRPEKQPPDEQTGRTNKQTETAVERAGERERRTRRHRPADGLRHQRCENKAGEHQLDGVGIDMTDKWRDQQRPRTAGPPTTASTPPL